jgi:hypothetical protein
MRANATVMNASKLLAQPIVRPSNTITFKIRDVWLVGEWGWLTLYCEKRKDCASNVACHSGSTDSGGCVLGTVTINHIQRQYHLNSCQQ